jgi:hypothetical protein
MLPLPVRFTPPAAMGRAPAAARHDVIESDYTKVFVVKSIFSSRDRIRFGMDEAVRTYLKRGSLQRKHVRTVRFGHSKTV